MRPLPPFAVAALALATATVLATTALGIHANTTASMPVGLYYRDTTAMRAGSIVAFCLDQANAAVRTAIERNYLPPGPCPSGTAPALKHVAAVAGDTVHWSAQGVFVNGRLVRNTAPLSVDAGGHLMPALSGSHTVPHGHFLALAPHSAHSFDSRYFGFVPEASVRAQLQPLLTRRAVLEDGVR